MVILITWTLQITVRFFPSTGPCSPVPEITWRRANGVPFPSKVKVQRSGAVLEIPDFQQEDAGGYECIAENTRGKNVARGRLSFHGVCNVLGTPVC